MHNGDSTDLDGTTFSTPIQTCTFHTFKMQIITLMTKTTAIILLLLHISASLPLAHGITS